MRGWVYVISNKAMPGLIKVGYTMKDPQLRARELNHTGSPHPYIVDYEVLVEDPRRIEQMTHVRLRDLREGKEWFNCEAEVAIAAIKAVVGQDAIVENYLRASRIKAESIRNRELDLAKKTLTEEDARIKREALKESRRQEIIRKYDSSINSALPESEFWVYAPITFVVLLSVLYSYLPKMKDGVVFFLAAVGSMVISMMLENYRQEKATKSEKYKDIIAKRDAELISIESDIESQIHPTPQVKKNSPIVVGAATICPTCKIFVPTNGVQVEFKCSNCGTSFRY